MSVLSLLPLVAGPRAATAAGVNVPSCHCGGILMRGCARVGRRRTRVGAEGRRSAGSATRMTGAGVRTTDAVSVNAPAWRLQQLCPS